MKEKVENARKFITAGKAIFTIRNGKTGNRFTYRVKKCKDKDIWFVSVLTGTDNEHSYTYMGSIFNTTFRSTAKSKITADAISYKAFSYTWSMLLENKLPNCIEIWHEGRCGRCGRVLTVPESIKSGFGPECINFI